MRERKRLLRYLVLHLYQKITGDNSTGFLKLTFQRHVRGCEMMQKSPRRWRRTEDGIREAPTSLLEPLRVIECRGHQVRNRHYTERNLYRLTGTRWRRMESVGSAESVSVIDACTQDCANFTLGAEFRKNSSCGAPARGWSEGVYFRRRGRCAI